MLAELRSKSQITLPKELVEKLGLAVGDKLDLFEREGMICMMPVVVYPKKYIEGLEKEIEAAKAKIASGEEPVFDTVDALIEKLGLD